MTLRILFLIFAVAALSASPPERPQDPRRAALTLLANGENEQALALLEAAADSDDPGFVAYHRGIALARLVRLREAELQFHRALDDDAIPAERLARAYYNRGLCLLARDDVPALRAAIDCFSRCRDRATDAALRADAMHNLELAKLRWQQARLKRAESADPNDGGLDSPRPGNAATASDAVPGGDPGGANAKPTPGDRAAKGTPKATSQTAPGAGNLPVLKDDAVLMPLSPDDTRAYLDSAAERLARQRRGIERLRGGPDRPGVRDW